MTAGLVPAGAVPALAETGDDPATTSAAHELAVQAEADGTCEPHQALVVYHASGAAKGSTGDISIQSEADPLADAGFSAQDSWDLSAADDAAASTGAGTDGALSVQSEPTGSAIASGSDVRVALVERDDMSVADLVDSLEALPCVECTSPNYLYEPSSLTNDTYSDWLWNLSGAGSEVAGSTAGVDYEAAGTGTGENVVAVIDTGVDYTNPDLAKNMWKNPGGLGIGPAGTYGYNGNDNTYDPMPEGDAEHGTHVAGIVAARSNNEIGVAGVAGNGNTKIMGLRAANDSGSLPLCDTMACYQYLIKAKLAGVNIVAVNNSWGSQGDKAPYNAVEDYAVNQAGKAGVLSCFAAGNDGVDVSGDHKHAMLESPYCINVAASNDKGALANYTSYDATAVDVAAPGSTILSTVPNAYAGSFDAALSIEGGKKDKLSYLTDIAELYGSGGLTVSLAKYDAKTKIIGDVVEGTNGAVSLSVASGAVRGQDALEVTVDLDKLPEGYTSKNVIALVSWNIDNPLYGKTGFTASDYAVSVTPQVDFDDPFEMAQTFERLLTPGGTDLLAGGSHATDPAHVTADGDGLSIHDAHLTCDSAAASSDASLTAQVGIHFMTDALDSSGTERTVTGTQSCLITDFAIGKATASTDADSATVPYAYESGTSMACPTISGCIAKLASLNSNATPLQLRGLVCGGTVPLTGTFTDKSGKEEHIASDGRFTFAAALDDDSSKVNANTWSITTSGNQVTVHGYNLDGAKLYVDDTSHAGTPAAVGTQAGSITLTASSSLLDGKAHRFDVVDGVTGRYYNAAYVTPDASVDSLVRVHDLPTAENASVAQLVSATDRLFCADGQGTYLYSCTEPSDATSAWTQLAAPGSPWTGEGNGYRKGLSFCYANGSVYAFATDDVPATAGTAEQVAVYCNVYDIKANRWSGFTTVATLATDFASIISSTSVGGKAVCLCAGSGESNCLIVEGNSKGSFSKVALTGETYAMAGVGSKAYGLTFMEVKGSPGTYGLALGTCDPSSSSPALESLADLPGLGTTGVTSLLLSNGVTLRCGVGNGIVCAWDSTTGFGDMQLVGTDGSMTKLGSYGLSAADGLTVGSAYMLAGRLYLNCVDHATEDGLSTGLYSLPAAAAAKLATTDVAETAAVSADGGGTATVSDWRGSGASELSVRSGDTVTWTATADAGHVFEGWYDAEGNKVSSDATYASTAAAPTALEARFAASPISPAGPASPVPTIEPASAASASTSSSSTTPSTSDGSPAVAACALALAGLALAFLGRRLSRR
jgi:plastocyanin